MSHYEEIRRDLTPPEIAVRERVYAEAMKPDQAHYPDEDEVRFTRTELRHLHESILQTGRELSSLRDEREGWPMPRDPIIRHEDFGVLDIEAPEG